MNQFLFLLIFTITAGFVIGLILIKKNIKKERGLKHANSSMIKIPYSEQAEKETKKIISVFGFPVSLDLVIEHLGKTPEIYITTEKKYFSKLKRIVEKITEEKYEIREDDYLIFHHEGFYEIFTGEIEKEDALRIDFKKIDLSKVNEIGEGVVIRMVFIPKLKAKIFVLFSAPSQLQLKEIIEGAIRPLKDKGCRIPKNKEEVLEEFNSPDFLNRAIK